MPLHRLLLPRLRALLALVVFLFSARFVLAPTPAAAQGRVVDEGDLARVGQVLGDAVVDEIRVHPEFQRYTARLPDGRALPLEVTVLREDTTPACQAEGLAVYPRWELLAEDGGEVRQDPAGAQATDALCAALTAQAETLQIGLLPEETGDAAGGAEGGEERVRHRDLGVFLPTQATTPEHPLQWVLAGLLLACLGALAGPLRRQWLALPGRQGFDVLAVLLVGLVARLLLSPRGLLIAPDAGYERVVLSWGVGQPHPLYGDGLSSLHVALQQATAYDPGALFGLHLALSALAPPLLWAVARGAGAGRTGALASGLGLALLPVALRLAGSEIAHVPLATFELLAVAGAWGFLRTGSPMLSLVGALAGGFAVHLRPEALPFTLLPTGLLLAGAWRGGPPTGVRWRARVVGVLAALTLVALVGWRLSTMPELESNGPVRFSAFLSPGLWTALVTPQLTWPPTSTRTYQVFLHLALTSPLLPLLALVGLVRGRRAAVVVAVAWWAITVIPIIPKGWPTLDAMRLQLAGQAPLLLLVGLGVGALPRAAWRRAALVAVAATSLLYIGWVRELWAGTAEWALLERAVAELPDDAIVLVPDHEKHGRKVREVGALLTRRANGVANPDWRAMGSFAADPDPGPHRYAWLNLACRVEILPGQRVANDLSINSCLQLSEVCELTPVLVEEVPPVTDIDLSFSTLPVEVGLYRVDDCHPKD